MIVNVDGKAIEWVAGSFLSGDVIAGKEIWDGVDQHSLNQEAFGLPNRLIAKRFIFRLIFGGTAYTYCHDPDFTDVSSKEKYWQGVIDKFNDKYKGWNGWWTKLIQEATTTGQVVNPATQRTYKFTPKKNWQGENQWPETYIKNYIVQGLAADIMSIARVSFMRRFKDADIAGVIVNSVHDSIVCDVERSSVDKTTEILFDVFNDLPDNFNRIFHTPFTLPLRCEVSIGPDMKELYEINRDSFNYMGCLK